MKLYSKNINGRKVVLSLKDIVLIVDDMQIINPSETQVLNNGWVEYIPVVDELKQAMDRKISEIINYDSSDNVNKFYIDNIQMWIDKPTRVGLRLRFESELNSGLEETTLWSDGVPFKLVLTDALNMLHAIELYASACYDNTQMHIHNIKNMDSVYEINNYVYTEGYPEVLYFNKNEE